MSRFEQAAPLGRKYKAGVGCFYVQVHPLEQPRAPRAPRAEHTPCCCHGGTPMWTDQHYSGGGPWTQGMPMSGYAWKVPSILPSTGLHAPQWDRHCVVLGNEAGDLKK